MINYLLDLMTGIEIKNITSMLSQILSTSKEERSKGLEVSPI